MLDWVCVCKVIGVEVAISEIMPCLLQVNIKHVITLISLKWLSNNGCISLYNFSTYCGVYGELVALLRLLFCWTFPFCCDELLCPFSILVIGLTVVGSWCWCWCCFCLVKLFANMLWYDGRSVAASFASPLVVGIIAWYLLLFPLDTLPVCSWLCNEIFLFNCNFTYILALYISECFILQ